MEKVKIYFKIQDESSILVTSSNPSELGWRSHCSELMFSGSDLEEEIRAWKDSMEASEFIEVVQFEVRNGNCCIL